MTNVTLTTEQAQQIEHALLPYAYQYVEMGAAYTVSDALVERALTILRAARAQEQAEQRPQNCGTGYCSCIECPYEAEQAEQEPLMDYERINALREGEQNGAEDAYFFVRPENDTPSLRKMFCQGFERGFHKGLKYAAPVQQVEQEPVAWRVRGYNQFKTGNPAPWRYVGGADKPAVNKPDCCDFEPLYTRPVRTKDLTDDEIMKINVDTASIVPTCDRQFHFARAVIAADRRKNK